jgi:hypothetical protein
MNEPRKHHYLPQFYLAGFTKTDARDGRLWVFDKRKLKQWATSPADAAAIRDYNTLDKVARGQRTAVEEAITTPAIIHLTSTIA